MTTQEMLPIRRFLQTMDVVRREGEHLGYSRTRVFGQPVDAQWVRELDAAPELAERLEAFVSRFGRMQDTIAAKLVPRWLTPRIAVFLDRRLSRHPGTEGCPRRLWTPDQVPGDVFGVIPAGRPQPRHPGRSEAESRLMLNPDRPRPPRHLQALVGTAAGSLSSNPLLIEKAERQRVPS